MCSFLKKDSTSKINMILMIIMKEKKAKRHLPSLSIYCFLKNVFWKKKDWRQPMRVGNSLFLPFLFLLHESRKDVKKTIIVFRPRKCINPHFFPQSFSFFFPSQMLSSTWVVSLFSSQKLGGVESNPKLSEETQLI